MSDVKNAVRNYIIETFIPGEDPENLTDDLGLIDSGVLDSMATLTLVEFLEPTFGIQIDSSDLDPENMGSLNLIESFIARKQQSASGG